MRILIAHLVGGLAGGMGVALAHGFSVVAERRNWRGWSLD